MFKIVEKSELCQVSLTGMRALAIVGLLMQEPRTIEEIRAELIKYQILEEDHSNDILRIDLNTLRTMGCEISKATSKTNYKYVLTKHPFSLGITSEEVALLKKVYNKVRNSGNIELLREYDNLFIKLASFVTDDNVKEEFHGICALKEFNRELVDELQRACDEEMMLEILYRNPVAKHDVTKRFVVQRLGMHNDKIYLYGFDIDKQEPSMLNVKRIKSILSKNRDRGGVDVKSTNVKFFLKSFGVNDIDKAETILETSENGFVVEGKYYNEFIAIQRILSFGANCTVLEPEDIKEKVIEKLKEMRNNYND